MTLSRQFIIDPPLSGIENMARDKKNFLLADRFHPDDFIIRIYEWERPTISLGISQNENLFDSQKLSSEGIGIVKRITGGKAVWHENEITYSVVAPISSMYFGNTLLDAYKFIAHILSNFLNHLNIQPEIKLHRDKDKNKDKNNKYQRSEICFNQSGIYEINLLGKKLIGSAQKRGKNSFLQHGSIPLTLNQHTINRYLLKNEEKSQEYFEHMTSLNEYCQNITKDELKEKLLDCFKKALD